MGDYMNILEFYKKNVIKNEYYYKFYNEIVTIPERREKQLKEFLGYTEDYKDEEIDDMNDEYEFFDDEDIIEKFKYLCQPDTTYSEENTILFYLITYYLYKSGYVLKEFPRLLIRPPEDPYQFTNNEIRNKAIENGRMRENGQVPYAERRVIISNFTFEKLKSTMVDENLDEIFKNISTRNAKFENMETEEKLKEIINAIEYMLKENKKYLSLDYVTISKGFVNEQNIIDYKSKLQCFRHSSAKAIEERKQISEAQKQFLIDYGIMICRMIYYNK